MKHSIIVCLLSVLACSGLRGQQIQINEDPAVSRLMTAWSDLNRAKPRIAGWRVQLMSVSDRKQAEEGKARFRSQFPDAHVDWYHEKPYYKLRAGAFLTKLEALAFIQEIKEFYPGAYAAQDNNIHPRELVEVGR